MEVPRASPLLLRVRRHRSSSERRDAARPALNLDGRTGQATEDPHDGRQKAGVDDHERGVADGNAAGAGHRLLGTHVAVDDPGLPPDLGRDPACDERDDRQWPGRDDGAVEPGGARQPLSPQPDEHVDRRDPGQEEADADHRLEGDANDVDRRTLGGGNLLESLHARARVVEGKQRQEARQRNPVADLITVVPAAEMDRRTLFCLVQPLEGRELGRLFTRNRARGPVADDDLHRGGQRGDCQRNNQRDPLVAISAAT